MVTDANENTVLLLIKSRRLTSVHAELLKLHSNLSCSTREFSITLKLVSHWIKDNSLFTSDFRWRFITALNAVKSSNAFEMFMRFSHFVWFPFSQSDFTRKGLRSYQKVHGKFIILDGS